jgi:hypothetical protein
VLIAQIRRAGVRGRARFFFGVCVASQRIDAIR